MIEVFKGVENMLFQGVEGASHLKKKSVDTHDILFTLMEITLEFSLYVFFLSPEHSHFILN